MHVYIFGNQDVAEDNAVFGIAQKVAVDAVEYVYVKPNQDVPFVGEDHVVIMDTVDGISNVTLIDESALDNIHLSPRVSVHDFDLSFQLKYLKKLGKIGRFSIIGIPMRDKIDYDSIQSILRKLVAHDMQGS